MGKSKDLATGETRFVNTAGDTMTGNLAINNASGSQVTLHRTDTTIANDDLYGQIILSGDDADTNASGTRGYIRGRSQGTGGGLKMEFGTAGGGVAMGSDPRMTINADGLVTIPNQPSMSGRSIRPVNTAGYANLSVNLYLNDIQHNNGNHWNNSTGVWTCPVAGRYWVFVSILMDDNTSQAELARYEIRKNGSEFFRGYDQSYNSGSTYGGMIASGGIFSCSANDTITIVGTNGKLHTGAESTFTICLLS